MFEAGYVNPTLSYLKILILHPDPFEVEQLRIKLGVLNHKILTTALPADALGLIEAGSKEASPVDLLIVNHNPADSTSLQILGQAGKIAPELHTAVLTSASPAVVLDELRGSGVQIDGLIHKAEDISKLRYFICSVFEEKRSRLREAVVSRARDV